MPARLIVILSMAGQQAASSPPFGADKFASSVGSGEDPVGNCFDSTL